MAMCFVFGYLESLLSSTSVACSMVHHWDVVSGDIDVWRKLRMCDFQGMFLRIHVSVDTWAFVGSQGCVVVNAPCRLT